MWICACRVISLLRKFFGRSLHKTDFRDIDKAISTSQIIFMSGLKSDSTTFMQNRDKKIAFITTAYLRDSSYPFASQKKRFFVNFFEEVFYLRYK